MFFISTGAGVYTWDESSQREHLQGLKDRDIHQVVGDGDGELFAFDGSNSLWRSDDQGRSWEQMKSDAVKEEITVLFVHPVSGELYLGAEPPKIYQYDRKADEWRLLADLSQLEVARNWYTPWGGPPAVRSIAPANGNGFYLDIHVGGVLRTLDGGKTWQPVNEGLHLDVHQVATSLEREGAVYAATAGGFHLSEDQGESWKVRNAGLPNRYTRGIAVHPDDPKLILISGSPTSPGGWRTHGKRFSLFRTTDDGLHWEKITRGLPEASDSEIDTHCIGFSKENSRQALCGLSSGVLYASDDAGASWSAAADLPPIRGLCAV